jgi:multidrug efflux system membrane fusion protein
MTNAMRWLKAGALLAAALGAGCGRREEADKPVRAVRVEPVASEEPAGRLRYSATVQPFEQVSLAFKAAGYVRELGQVRDADGRLRSVQQGDEVVRGTVLARIHPADYVEKANQAKAQLAEAEAVRVRAQADATRAGALYEGKALTRPDYDAATANRASAVARAEAARAQLEAAQLALRDTDLTAPMDGVLLSRSVEVGTLAAVGTAAFQLADLSRVKAVFGVPDHVAQRVQMGRTLTLTSDTFAGLEFPGRITAVSPSADAESRVFSVEVTIANSDRRLKAGMIATVEVETGEHSAIQPGSPTVSVSAIVKSSRPGAFAVFVADGPDDGASARARDVTLGGISGNRIAVTGGLEPGDRVIVSGASLLVDGERVRVIPGEGE